MQIFDNKKEVGGYLLVASVLLLVLPMLNTFLAEGDFLHVSSFQLSLWGKYICYAVLAMSLNFLWGYTGLLCLCQSLFFALGGYAFGMYLMLNVGVDPVYNSALPDFMDFMGFTELPVHWKPFHSFLFTAGAVLWVPGLVAFIFGFLAFRSRIKGVYFSILTQALTYAAALLFYRNEFTFGGNNGFTDFKKILGAEMNDPSTQRWLFIGSAALMLLVYVFLSWIIKTKFGKVQQAIRDSEARVRFSGYSTTSYKLLIFTVSAMIAGAAGAFYVPQVGIINPGEMTAAKSLDVVVWVALGGRGTKFGPVIGALIVNVLKSFATRAYPDSWLIILGLIFIFVVLFMPNGVVGLPAQIKGWIAYYKSKTASTALPKGVA